MSRRPVLVERQRVRRRTAARTRSAGCSACRPRTATASPSWRSSGCSPCSTAARRRPAWRSATAAASACTSSRARVQRVHPRGAGPARRLPRHRPHPLLDDRREHRPQHPAVRRRDDARPAGPRPQRQHRQHGEPARRAALTRVRADGVERLRGDDADARRRRRAVLGGPHRAHAAGVEGRLLARPAVRRPRPRRARPVGLPTAVRRPPAPRRLRRRQRDVRPRRRSAASTSREVAPGEIVTLQGTELHRRQALTPARRGARCTFEFVYFSRPDSVWDGRNVHHVRERSACELARESASTPTS